MGFQYKRFSRQLLILVKNCAHVAGTRQVLQHQSYIVTRQDKSFIYDIDFIPRTARMVIESDAVR